MKKYASALPSTFTPTRSPDNAQKPQIWPISAKGSPQWGKSTERDQNACKPQILPVSLSQNSIKIRKIYKL